MISVAKNTANSSGSKNNTAPLAPRRRVFIAFIVGLVIVLVLGLGTLTAGVYAAHWSSPVVKRIVRLVPIPAVSVNGRWRSYYDFLDAVGTLEYSFNQEAVRQASGLTTKPPRPQIQTIVLDRLVKEELVRQLARRRGVTVSTADIEAEMQKLIEQSGDAATVTAQIKQLYNWDLATFRQRVVEPYLLRQRLQESIAADEAINKAEAERAQQLLERVERGQEDFQAIAREVNDDVTKGTGGDLGVFGRGEREAALDEAAFGLEVGRTSGIVRSREGFHLLKVLEKIPADEKTGDGERVHVAHIFVSAKPLDQWLYEQAQQYDVTVFITGFRWDRSTAQVIAATGSANAAP
ncbi:MAG: peptidylprolyl isomerase [Candidatus Kerfeldbacteria bacterium]|nr:peptidylprolyl isomerase [Candidatus Kerfeldbacteria bacterium]